MIRRVCRYCGAELYSADAGGIWVCTECQGEIWPEGVGE